MTWNRATRVVIAIIGFLSTSWGAVQADRLSVEGANAGPWEWAGVAGLFAVTAAGLLARVAMRTVESAGQQTATKNSGPLVALGKESARLLAAGDIVGAAVILDAARQLRGDGGTR